MSTQSTDAKSLNILKTAARNPVASPEEITAQLDFPADPDEVADVLNSEDLPEEYGPDGEYEVPPKVKRDRYLEIYKDNPDIWAETYHREAGYIDSVVDAFVERYGPRFEPERAYVSANASKFRDMAPGRFPEELRFVFEDDDPVDAVEDELEDRLDADDNDDTDDDAGTMPATGAARAHHVLEDNHDWVEPVLDGDEEIIEQVQEKATKRWGRLYQPTDGSVRKAAADINVNEAETDQVDTDYTQKLVYECALCGYEDTDPSAVRKHVTAEDDAVHRNRSGGEPSVLITRGEPGEQPDADAGGDIEDGFEVLWAIHQNPDARMKDIAAILGVSQGTVSNRLNDLDIDWQERQDEVADRLEDLGLRDEEPASIRREAGNVVFEGPETGLDMRTTSYLAEAAERTQPARTETPVATDEESGDAGRFAEVVDRLETEELYELVSGEPNRTKYRLFRAAVQKDP